MSDIAQVVGALLILVAFALAQFGRMEQRSLGYLVLNIVGSGILAVVAYVGSQPGFLLLEGAWALVSLWSLGGVIRQSRAA